VPGADRSLRVMESRELTAVSRTTGANHKNFSLNSLFTTASIGVSVLRMTSLKKLIFQI
jgi:hypothetical protein